MGDLLMDALVSRMRIPEHLKSSAKELIEASLSNTSAIIQMVDERAALKSVLRRILDDLPQNRDWLDPDLEKMARELVK